LSGWLAARGCRPAHAAESRRARRRVAAHWSRHAPWLAVTGKSARAALWPPRRGPGRRRVLRSGNGRHRARGRRPEARARFRGCPAHAVLARACCALARACLEHRRAQRRATAPCLRSDARSARGRAQAQQDVGRRTGARALGCARAGTAAGTGTTRATSATWSATARQVRTRPACLIGEGVAAAGAARSQRAALRRAEGRPRRASTGAAALSGRRCAAQRAARGVLAHRRSSLEGKRAGQRPREPGGAPGDAHARAVKPLQACARGASPRGVSVPVRGGRRVRRARGSDLHGHRGPGRAACGGPGRPEQAAAGARATGLGSGMLWGCLRAQGRAAGLRAQESALQNALGGRWA